jgi:hypothetical protein
LNLAVRVLVILVAINVRHRPETAQSAIAEESGLLEFQMADSNPRRKVFDTGWVEKQRKKYGHQPSFNRPSEYDFWTADDLQSHRDNLERLVDELVAESKRAKVIENLRKPGQYRHTYNELFVGDSLRGMGHALDYELEMHGLTPDWRGFHFRDHQEFVVEVLTSGPPEDRANTDDGWDLLRRRIESLNIGAHVGISPPMDSPPPTAGELKEISRRVAIWLRSNPPEGDETELHGVRFRFIKSHLGNNVCCGISLTPFIVDAVPLKDAVIEKASKYKEIILQNRLPLVVTVIAEFSTGRGVEDLRDAVLGTQRCRICVKTGREEHYRDNDGVFDRYPTLSAVTFGEWVDGKIIHSVISNPKATFPLPEGTFPEGLGEV